MNAKKRLEILNIPHLVAEYRTAIKDHRDVEIALASADFTPKAARHLINLAEDYGAWMLRNAYALALALDIEDGDLGF